MSLYWRWRFALDARFGISTPFPVVAGYSHMVMAANPGGWQRSRSQQARSDRDGGDQRGDRHDRHRRCGGDVLGNDAVGSPSPGALARLIGPARAGILVQLAEPRSTSQLVASTGYVLGSAGSHLKVLLDAELVQRRRAGRSVLYYRTSLGDRLAGMRG
jgi:DNA-binding transcriptional ArsR family regulator